MNPQTDNQQNNNSDKIKIIPNRSGVSISASDDSGNKFFNIKDVKKEVKTEIKKDSYSNIEPVEKSEYRPEDKIKISPLHTYADDVKNAVEGGKISMVKMMMAEAKKQEAEKENEEEVSPTSPKNIKIISLSIGLILLAVVSSAIAWYFIGQKNTNSFSKTTAHRQSIIPYDEEFNISLDTYTRKKIIEGISSAKLKNYERDTGIIYITITDQNSTSTESISTDNFLAILETRTPQALQRSFGNKFMLGLDKNLNQTEPFIILTSDSFTQMYAGMLEWEPALADDIGYLFFAKEDLIDVTLVANVATSTKISTSTLVASTTPQTFATQNLAGQAKATQTNPQKQDLNRQASSTSTVEVPQQEVKPKYILANSLKFKDELLRNRDMRVLRNTSGKVLMYYTFINENIVLIAKDFNTLEEVVKRLATTQFKQ